MTDWDPNAPDVPSASTPAPPPPGAPTEAMPIVPGTEEFTLTPWYKKPAGIAALATGAALLLGGLIFGLVWAGSDDDTGVVVAKVIMVPKDESGAGLDRAFIVDVTGTAEFPASFVWLEPDSGPGPDGMGGESGGSGRVTFAWAPSSEVVEPSSWTSTITLNERSPAGFVPPGPVVECVLSRPEVPDTTISMDVVVDPPDPTVAQRVTYTFPTHEFLPGDTVTCELVSRRLPPDPTTSVVDVPTTVADATTTVAETATTAAAPTTAATQATVPPTAAPTTAAATTTAAPAQPATATEALQAAGGYGSFLSAASGVPSVQALLDGAGPVTVFAPNDAAMAAAALPADAAELEQLLLSHIVSGSALDAASVFDGSRTEVAVASGGTQPIVQSPPTVGGASVVQPDLFSTSGVSHGIDTVLSPTP